MTTASAVSMARIGMRTGRITSPSRIATGRTVPPQQDSRSIRAGAWRSSPLDTRKTRQRSGPCGPLLFDARKMSLRLGAIDARAVHLVHAVVLLDGLYLFDLLHPLDVVDALAALAADARHDAVLTHDITSALGAQGIRSERAADDGGPDDRSGRDDVARRSEQSPEPAAEDRGQETKDRSERQRITDRIDAQLLHPRD